jgi:hypothetical protein
MARTAIALAALVLTAVTPRPAIAGGAVEARYAVTFTGVAIGTGALVVEINDEGYSAAGSAMVAGLLQMVTGGKGTAAARGQFIDGRVVPISYSGNSESHERSQEVRLSGAAGTIREVVIPPRPAALLRSGRPLSPAATRAPLRRRAHRVVPVLLDAGLGGRLARRALPDPVRLA